jgi:anaerobic ribonucleoside-triphosphate reductase activating protein
LLVDPAALADQILAEAGIEGLTVSGGEPFAQATALLPLIRMVKAAGLSVMVFTGYERSELLDPDQLAVLEATDILVTGRFRETLRASDLPWRGSSNQQVHFLTGRYDDSSMTNVAELEYHIQPDGSVTVTGFPPTC